MKTATAYKKYKLVWLLAIIPLIASSQNLGTNFRYNQPKIEALAGKTIIIKSETANNHLFAVKSGKLKVDDKTPLHVSITGHPVKVIDVVREKPKTRRDRLILFLQDGDQTIALVYRLSPKSNERFDYLPRNITGYSSSFGGDIFTNAYTSDIIFECLDIEYLEELSDILKGTRIIDNAKLYDALNDMPIVEQVGYFEDKGLGVILSKDTTYFIPWAVEEFDNKVGWLRRNYENYSSILDASKEKWNSEYQHLKEAQISFSDGDVYVFLTGCEGLVPKYQDVKHLVVLSINDTEKPIDVSIPDEKFYHFGGFELRRGDADKSFDWYIRLSPLIASEYGDLAIKWDGRLYDNIITREKYNQIPFLPNLESCGGDRLKAEIKTRGKENTEIAFNRFIESVSNDLAEATNQKFIGENLWISGRTYYTGSNPSTHCTVIKHGDGTVYPPMNTIIDHEWTDGSYETFWDGMMGGTEFKLYHFRFAGITRRPTYTNPIGSYGRPIYYAALLPIPDQEYRRTSSPPYDPILGSAIKDTLFVPFSEEFLSLAMTDTEKEQFSDKFDAAVKKMWEEWNNRINTKREIYKRLYGEEAADIMCGGRVRFGFTTQMCKLALEGEPYQISTYVSTPLGLATMYHFYTQDIKLYFIDDILIGIAWRGNAIEYRT